jgi:cytochrome c6
MPMRQPLGSRQPFGSRQTLGSRRFAILLALLSAAAAAPVAAQDERLGEQVFMERAQPPCRLCHKLAAAGAEGEIGPDLDELAPTRERVRTAVERGVGNMPPFGETLSREEIEAVSRYVAEAVKR